MSPQERFEITTDFLGEIRNREKEYSAKAVELRKEADKQERKLVDFLRLEEEMWDVLRQAQRGEPIDWHLTGDPEVVEEFDMFLRNDGQPIFSQPVRSPSSQELIGTVHFYPIRFPGLYSKHTESRQPQGFRSTESVKTITIVNAVPFQLQR